MSSNPAGKRTRAQRCWTTFDKKPSEPDDMLDDLEIESCSSPDELMKRDSSDQEPTSSRDHRPRSSSPVQETTRKAHPLFDGSKDQSSREEKKRVSYARSESSLSSDLEEGGSLTSCSGVPSLVHNKKAPESRITAREDKPVLQSDRRIPESPESLEKPTQSLVFDDDGVENIYSHDEDLNWSSQRLDWDGFFLPRSTPQENYPFEGTGSSTETLINLTNSIPEPIRRARRRLAEVIANSSPQSIPLDLLKNAPEEIRRLIEKARVEGRQVPEKVREWAEVVRRVATEVVNAVPPLDVQVGARRERTRR